MESLFPEIIKLLKHLLSILGITGVVCGFVWLLFKTAIMKAVEESVSHGFKVQLSKLELSHKNQFSHSDEMRKTIFEINRSLIEFVVFFYFMTNDQFPMAPEDEYWEDVKQRMYDTTAAWEKLTLIHPDNEKNAILIVAYFKRVDEVGQLYKEHNAIEEPSDEQNEQFVAKVKEVLNKLETVEYTAIRNVLSGYYLGELSK